MKEIKVLHVGTLDMNAGGPAMSTYLTLCGLKELHIAAELLSYPLPVGNKPIGKDVLVHYATAPIDKKLLFSFSLTSEMQKLGNFDIYHAQGIWQYPTYAMASVARRNKKPYLITPRGMLYPQDIIKSNKVFKKLSLKLRLMKDLNLAACVQVTCLEEMEHCRNLGVTSPIAVIPNPIVVKEYPIQKNDKIFRLGYLGRLSPRKKVENLIYAWKGLEMQNNNAELLIIGSDDKGYEEFLKREVVRLNLSNVRFLGFLSGDAKDQVLASLSILAMPSEFENFGNVILEGLIRGIPCIATRGAPWQDLETHHCGWWIEYNQNALTESISQAFSLDDVKLKKMGANGIRLAKSSYSIDAVAQKMKSLYAWILKEGFKPDFVYERT